MRPGLLLQAALCCWTAAATWAQTGPPPFVLGVQTHFEQGWDTGLIGAARGLQADALRDEVGWAETERQPGIYGFAAADAYMKSALEQGLPVLIVVTDTNPLYDGGHTPHSKSGRKALAEFLNAVLARYGDSRVVLEIGNEPNSDDFVSGPFRRNRPAYLAALAGQVRKTVQADHPEARIICTGVNTIALGFLREFFRRGGLQACDGISVHPYRDNPETVVFELERLKALMREFGGEKPLYATEFGKWFDDPAEAPDYMVKMVAQLAAAGVAEAYWYALKDEPWWPNMGLLDSSNAEKPAAAGFRFLQERLLPLGRPALRSTDPALRVYEFGTGGRGFVFWGAGGEISVTGDAAFFDTQGRRAEPVTRISDRPVAVLGSGLELRASLQVPVADTRYQFGQDPWSYFALRPETGLTPLEIIDGNWSSYRGAPDLLPLRISDGWITTARFRGRPFHAVERYTAKAAGEYRIEGWWEAAEKGEASRLIVQHNRKTIAGAGITAAGFSLPDLRLKLQAGDTVDFEIAPDGANGDGSVRRRVRVHGPFKRG